MTPYLYFLGLTILSLILATLFGQSAEASDTNYSSATGFGFLIMIILFILTVGTLAHLRKRKRRERSFSTETRREIRKRQGYKCAMCNWNSGVFDYDHKDGNRHNNNILNCQALCPNCHAKKTRGLIHSEKHSHSHGWLKVCAALFFILVFIVIFIAPPK